MRVLTFAMWGSWLFFDFVLVQFLRGYSLKQVKSITKFKIFLRIPYFREVCWTSNSVKAVIVDAKPFLMFVAEGVLDLTLETTSVIGSRYTYYMIVISAFYFRIKNHQSSLLKWPNTVHLSRISTVSAKIVKTKPDRYFFW